MASRALAAGLEPEPSMGHARLPVKSGVTLQAKLAAFAPRQQHPVSAAMRCMAGSAAFNLQRRMLIDIGPAFFRVTADASLIIRLLQAGMVQRPVRIMAVSALHQTFGDAMVHRQCKLRLHVVVATEAQLRLRFLQEAAVQPSNFIRKLRHLEEVPLRRSEFALALVLDFIDQVRGVALIARKSVRGVAGVLKEFLLLAAGMAQQATRGILLGVRTKLENGSLLKRR